MIASAIMSLIVVGFAFIAGNSRYTNRYLLLSFSILFVFLALRYDFGNDYMTYYEYFDAVHQYSLSDLFNVRAFWNPALMEVGYTWLNRIMPHFFIMLALLSLFSVYTLYRFMSQNLPTHAIWFAFFIYLFLPSFMLIHSSAIRQSISICFFILSIPFLVQRDFLKYFLVILLASFFHRSALVLIPVYFIVTPKVWNRQFLYILVGVFILMSFFSYQLIAVFERITSLSIFSDYRYYLVSSEGASLGTGFGFLFRALLFVFVLWSHDRCSPQMAVVNKLAIIGFLLLPLRIYLLVFARMTMYFDVALIIALPFAIYLQESKQLRIVLLSIIGLWCLYEYRLFFQNPLWATFTDYSINLLQVF